MMMEFKIPVRPHLKKYFLAIYNQDLPMHVNKNSKFGLFIIKSFSETKNKNKPLRKNDFTDLLEIKFWYEYDLTFSHGNVLDFNSMLEGIYRKDLGMFISIDNLFNSDAERKRSIELFNDKFGITEEDIHLETLLKHYQRHPEDMKIFDFQNLRKVS